jgi:hypothetical protein
MTQIKRVKPSQKLRVIIDTVGIYTTARAVRGTQFYSYSQNAAAQKALDALENMRSGKGTADSCAVGLCGTWDGHRVQLDILT